MAGYFLDSSATVKRYVRETGTSWVINLFRDPNQNSFYSARITLVEVISAFSRRLKAEVLHRRKLQKLKVVFDEPFKESFSKLK